MDQELQQAVKDALSVGANLKLLPPVCAGNFDGKRLGVKTGGAMEFADYRSYREGDDLRRIDWQLYARSEQLMVRRFAQETDPRCDIIIDRSSSMAFYGKNAAAAGVAALFAKSALNGGFSLQVWELGSSLRKMNAPEEPGLWEFSGEEKENFVPEVFEKLRFGLFRNGIRILISDLFFPLSPGELLKFLDGGSVILIQILGREELSPTLSGPVCITDPESGRSRTLRADGEMIERYRARLARFQMEYDDAVRSRSGRFFFFNASELTAHWNVELLCREGVLQ